jgi:hypothetical protein
MGKRGGAGAVQERAKLGLARGRRACPADQVQQTRSVTSRAAATTQQGRELHRIESAPG